MSSGEWEGRVRTSRAGQGREVPRYLCMYCSIGTALGARPTHGQSQRLWGAGLMRQDGRVAGWTLQSAADALWRCPGRELASASLAAR